MGSQSFASFSIRSHVKPSFWLRRRSVRRQRSITGTGTPRAPGCLSGLHSRRRCPSTTCLSHLPCSGIGWCIRRRSSPLMSRSFARMRSRRVFRLSWKSPRRDVPQMNVNPKNVNVSGLPRPRSLAVRPPQSGRTRSGESCPDGATARIPQVVSASHRGSDMRRPRARSQRPDHRRSAR